MELKSWKLREKVCSDVDGLDVEIDEARNRNLPADRPSLISSASSKTRIWIVPIDEEIVILKEILSAM